MTLFQGRGQLCRERNSKESSSPLESNHNKTPVDFPFGSFISLVAKYTKEDLQTILRTILEARALSSDRPCKKPLKNRSPDMYCNKFHMEAYNFY